MITPKFQAVILLAVALYFILLFYFLKKRRLNLKYTLLWIFSGIVMLMFALFPGLLDQLCELLGVYNPVNALFAILFFCGIIILVSLTAIVSKLNDRLTQLTQTTALLEKRLRELEGKKNGGQA